MELNMNEFEEIYFARQRRMWEMDISLLKDGVYGGDIDAPKEITEFKGFKEEFKLGINEVSGYLSFFRCTSLTSVGVLPENIGGSLSFDYCESLTSVEQFPKVVNGAINTYSITFFEDMTEEQIREKYNISK